MTREEAESFSGLSSLRVLAAEDNYVNRELLQKMFETLDIRDYRLAENGGEVVDILEKDPGYWDVVLLDLEMPVMDGFQLTQRIRDDARFTSLGIVALSSLADPTDMEAATSAGVDAYLVKLDEQELVAAVLTRMEK